MARKSDTLTITVSSFGVSCLDGDPYKIGVAINEHGVPLHITANYSTNGLAVIHVRSTRCCRKFCGPQAREEFQTFMREQQATRVTLCRTPNAAYEVATSR